jgi:hypothetical protein
VCDRVEGAGVSLTWDPNPDSTVAGYVVHYGLASHNYTVEINVGSVLSTEVDGLQDGVPYFFAVSAYNSAGYQNAPSAEATVITAILPEIVVQPSSQIAQAGAEVSLFVQAIFTPPVAFQWYNGPVPLAGATNSVLLLPELTDADAGAYFVVMTNAAGIAVSQTATVTVIDPSGENEGGSPSGTQLGTSGAPGGQDSTNWMASAAGTYEGLFYQTNDLGLPAIDEGTAGLLSNCALDSQGNYYGEIYNADLSYPVMGVLDARGYGISTIDRGAFGLPNLSVAVNMNQLGDALQLSGTVSNMDAANPWTSALTAVLVTNEFARPPNFSIAIPPLNGYPGALITGIADNGLVALSSTMGDGTIISQTTPVSAGGSLPLFVEFNQPAGLLAGWVNAFGNPATVWLTWTSIAGGGSPGFTNVFEATVAPLIGAP